MRIAVLGANGVFGGFLTSKLQATPLTRSNFDLLNSTSVLSFFQANPFDVVINAAIHSDSSMDSFKPDVLANNLRMFANLYNARNSFGRLISFGSGAEFDRTTNIENACEEQIFDILPVDHYGLSKNTISRISSTVDSFYTLRIFGAFAPNESPSRLLPKILSGAPITIQDRYFDYIYLQDLIPIIGYFSTGKPKYKDINVVYNEKILLSNFIHMFCKVNNLREDHINISEVTKINYTGDGSKLSSLDLPQFGLEYGCKNYK